MLNFQTVLLREHFFIEIYKFIKLKYLPIACHILEKSRKFQIFINKTKTYTIFENYKLFIKKYVYKYLVRNSILLYLYSCSFFNYTKKIK